MQHILDTGLISIAVMGMIQAVSLINQLTFILK